MSVDQQLRRPDQVQVSFHRRWLTEIASRYATLFLLVVLVVVFSFLNNEFMTAKNIQALLVSEATTGMLALAALCPLLVGEFDLSLGFNIGFIAMVGAWLAGHHFPPGYIIPAMLVVAVLVGIVNAILTVYLHIGAFISTLAIGSILSALTVGLSGGQVLFQGIPSFITAIGQNQFAGIAISVWLTLLVALILWYALEYTPLGRRLYAVGASERVAFLAGIRTAILKSLGFALAALLVGVAAVFALGQAGSAQPDFGPDLLLPAYGAAFLGITAYRPGYYNVPGTVIALLLIAVGFNGLSLMGAPFWMQPLFSGVVLLVAVLIARKESRHLSIGGL